MGPGSRPLGRPWPPGPQDPGYTLDDVFYGLAVSVCGLKHLKVETPLIKTSENSNFTDYGCLVSSSPSPPALEMRRCCSSRGGQEQQLCNLGLGVGEARREKRWGREGADRLPFAAAPCETRAPDLGMGRPAF